MCAKAYKINEGFICQNCGNKVEPAKNTCRNHCNICLHSLHVDKEVPGDRNSECKSLMEPLSVEKNKKGWSLIHKCKKCKAVRKNIVLDDDNWDLIIELSNF